MWYAHLDGTIKIKKSIPEGAELCEICRADIFLAFFESRNKISIDQIACLISIWNTFSILRTDKISVYGLKAQNIPDVNCPK